MKLRGLRPEKGEKNMSEAEEGRCKKVEKGCEREERGKTRV